MHRTAPAKSSQTPSVVTDPSGAMVSAPVDFSQAQGSVPTPFGALPQFGQGPPPQAIPGGSDYQSQLNQIYQPAIDALTAPQPAPGYFDTVAQNIANNPVQPSFGFRPRGADAFFQNLIASAANSWANQRAAGIRRPAEQAQAALQLATLRAQALKDSMQGRLAESEIQKNTTPPTSKERYLTPDEARAYGLPLSATLTPIGQLSPSVQGKIAPAIGGQASGADPSVLARMVYEGTIPPEGANFGRGGLWAATLTELRKIDPTYNVTKAKQDYMATNRYWGQLNGRQQVQIRQSANTLSHMFPDMLDTAQQLYSILGTTNIQAANTAKLGLAQDWNAYGSQAQALRQRLVTQMASAVPELANVYQAGGVPSDKALSQAREAINADMPLNRLLSAVKAEQDNLRYRANSISSVSAVTPDNPYEPVFNVPDPTEVSKARSFLKNNKVTP